MRESRLLKIIQDLDRCQHGRHRGDTCAGYRPDKPHAGCLGGISLGNPFLTPGRPIGYDRCGTPYIMPVVPFTTGEPKAWIPQATYGLDVYLETRHQVEPVLLLPTEENRYDGADKHEVQRIVDDYGWAILPVPHDVYKRDTITIGMSSRGLPEVVLYGVEDSSTATVILNAVACAHAQTIDGLAEGTMVRIGQRLVTVLGPDPGYGHCWHPLIGQLYKDEVPVIGVIA